MVGISFIMVPSVPVIVGQFNDLGIGLRSLREPLKQSIQTVISPSIRKNFSVGGRPSWQPLSESRSAQKEAQGLPPDVLVATGKLARVAGQLNIWKINGGYGSGEAEAFVSDLPGAEYGFFHEYGTEDMPSRPFMEVQEEDVEGVLEVFDNYIAMRMARAGF